MASSDRAFVCAQFARGLLEPRRVLVLGQVRLLPAIDAECAAIAATSAGMREASTGRRLAATVPVRLGVLSATCRRSAPAAGPPSPRPLAQARACITCCGPGPSRSSSRLTMTSQFVEPIVQVDRAAEREPHRLARGSPCRTARTGAGGIRAACRQLPELADQRWRGHVAEQQAQPLPLFAAQSRRMSAEGALERGPGARHGRDAPAPASGRDRKAAARRPA